MIVAALVVSIVSALIALAACAAAWRSSAASVRSAAESKRANDRNDRLDSEAAERESLERRSRAVTWTISSVSGSEWELRNGGEQPAHDVTIDTGGNGLIRDAPAGVVLAPNQAHRFLIIEVDQEPMPSELLVTWDGNPEGVYVPVGEFFIR